jgi:hypothetical protein
MMYGTSSRSSEIISSVTFYYKTLRNLHSIVNACFMPVYENIVLAFENVVLAFEKGVLAFEN